MKMTTDEFTHAYLSGMYKRLTAQHLSVQELRAALALKGEFRTLKQVHADLKLYGYAATHTMPRPPTSVEPVQTNKAESARRLEFKPCPDYEVSKRNSISDSIRRAAL